MKFNAIVSTQESIREDYALDLPPEEDLEFRTSPGAVLQNGLTDAEQTCRDIENVGSAIDDGFASIDRIDELKAIVLENPELEDNQIELIRSTHESIMAHLGLSAVYTSESLRPGCVVATLEEAKSGIWQGIVNMFKKLAETVMSFLAGFLKNTWMLTKYLKFLESRVKDIKDGPSEKTMPLFRPVAYKGKADFSSAYSIGGSAIKMTDLALKTVGIMQEFQGTFKQTISKTTQSYEEKEHHKEYDQDAVVYDDKEIGLHNFPIDGEGVAALSGNRQFDNDYIGTTLRTQVSNYPVPKSSEVLTPSEMKSLLQEAGKVIDGIKKVESKKSIIKSIMDSVINFSMEFAGMAQKATKGTLWQTSYYRRIVIRMTKSYLGESFRSAKALLDYVKVCLKYYTFTKETDNSEYGASSGETKRLEGSEKVHKVDWELA